MMKAYEMVEWMSLTKVLRKLGFSERIIDMVYRLVGNNWYSISLNVKLKGFFKSSRGLKKGDILSSTLYFLARKSDEQSSKIFYHKKKFRMFGMPRESPRINYLEFANDMIILFKDELGILQKVKGILE